MAKPTPAQRVWNGDFFPDEWSVRGRPPVSPPSGSWWVCPSTEFNQRLERELPRMQRSLIAQQLRPFVLGGKLP